MDYKIKYNKALEKAKKLYGKYCINNVLEDLFPELKESEDERMLREIKRYIKEQGDKPTGLPNGTVSVSDMIAWLDRQGENKEFDDEWEVSTGLYKCIKRMFDDTPEGKLLFETGNLYKCISKHDIAEFESSYGHSVFLIDPVVRKHFIKVEDEDERIKFESKFKPGDWISNGRYVKKIIDINSDWPYYIFQDGSSYRIKEIDTKWHIMPNVDELKWVDMETKECHCYNCELFDRQNNMCKCTTLCKEYHNTYKGFYTK